MNRSGQAAPILLDTHYWIWLQVGAEKEFSEKARKAVESAAAQGNLLLSMISPIASSSRRRGDGTPGC